jgi:hypothetical protein
MNATKSFRGTLAWLAAVTLLLSVSANCDMVTTIDNVSLYGVIEEVTATSITVESSFSSGNKSYIIPREKVTRIDLNYTTYNPGAPPKTMGLGPGDGQGPQARAAPPADTIVLRGSDQEPCKLVSIDASVIHCKERDYSRDGALYILLGRSH